MPGVRRIYVEKRRGFDVAARSLLSDLREYAGIAGLEGLRILIRYDMEGVSDRDFSRARNTVFSEPPVDVLYENEIEILDDEHMFVFEYLPGQYDQRADSASQCVQIMSCGDPPLIKTANVVILKGRIGKNDLERIKKYLINPVDSHETGNELPDSLFVKIPEPGDVEILKDFNTLSVRGFEEFIDKIGLAMGVEDLAHCQNYFKNEEKRAPSITEIKMLDTYWSDHCRHTTFLTKIVDVGFEKNKYTVPVINTYNDYLKTRKRIYRGKQREISLMDLALIAMRDMKKAGLLNDLEKTDEINACSIVVEGEYEDGKKEDWLVMFKNETHNHPTEIEPFGGAATCLGGAIRDPLSGRSYVYQAMRVTGCGDPRKKITETLPGKLPQHKITIEAARGYSSYGNQIGLATGIVDEIYHEGYIAKHMEVGAVIAAAPRRNVFRGKPEPGDIVILCGGRTGRDGCGGATGSSKEHTLKSLTTCGAEVQKGNPPTERKLQRLFRNPEASRLIKVCNDFGAGGVSVAIGELADGLIIDLDAVPKKYEGLDGTELAISESQERMAVLLSNKDVDKFISLAEDENLEAVRVAIVTQERRVVIKWRGKKIVDLSRDFIDTNGVLQKIGIEVVSPSEENNFFRKSLHAKEGASFKEKWFSVIKDLNIGCKKGLVERFDSTIGAGTVILPFGGKYQLTPAESMVAKLPALSGDIKTGTIMSYGCNPLISSWSPYHGAVYGVLEAVSKIAAAGGSCKKIRLSLQEYFQKLGKDEKKWGKPFSALLGAYYAQKELGIPAIGGKDSMSGSFEDMDVPPTLIAFAVCSVDVNFVISPEFKSPGNRVIIFRVQRDNYEMPDLKKAGRLYLFIEKLIRTGKIISAHTVSKGGIAAAVSKMVFGNKIGMAFNNKSIGEDDLFEELPGSIICEMKDDFELKEIPSKTDYVSLGKTIKNPEVKYRDKIIKIETLLEKWIEPLSSVFPLNAPEPEGLPIDRIYAKSSRVRPSVKVARPRVFIPVFPGTNCEYDTAEAFEKAGGLVETFVIKNLTPARIEESLSKIVEYINSSRIIMLPGGFSAGDEPDGSAKFISAVFRSPAVAEAVFNLMEKRDGLILGICNGFQALIKLGLLPFGSICEVTDKAPSLTFNSIGRHVSCVVQTRITSGLSPWLMHCKVGDLHSIPVSHGEGRFTASDDIMSRLFENGQVATQYTDICGNPTHSIQGNPNGSLNAIEGICSPDGRILGKMGHSERNGKNVARNIHGEKDQGIFRAGIDYFR